MPPTRRQLDLLRYLAETWRRDIDPPSYRAAAEALGVASTNAVACLMLRLRKKGLVRDPSWHSMRPTDAGYQAIGWKQCACGAWTPPDTPMGAN